MKGIKTIYDMKTGRRKVMKTIYDMKARDEVMKTIYDVKARDEVMKTIYDMKTGDEVMKTIYDMKTGDEVMKTIYDVKTEDEVMETIYDLARNAVTTLVSVTAAALASTQGDVSKGMPGSRDSWNVHFPQMADAGCLGWYSGTGRREGEEKMKEVTMEHEV